MDLLLRVARGDEGAISKIHKEYYGLILGYSNKILGNRSDAEDVTCETFLRIIKKAGELRSEGAFKTWMFRIARNLCIDKLRQKKMVDIPFDKEVESVEEASAVKIAVRSAVNSLPRMYREPLVLCDIDDMTAKVAAEMLEISVPALKSRLYRGRRAMRANMENV